MMYEIGRINTPYSVNARSSINLAVKCAWSGCTNSTEFCWFKYNDRHSDQIMGSMLCSKCGYVTTAEIGHDGTIWLILYAPLSETEVDEKLNSFITKYS